MARVLDRLCRARAMPMPIAVTTTRVSPNYSERDGHAITLLLIHATVGGLEGSLAWLCNPVAKVSAHYVIGKDGTIYQLVPDEYAAWHAGKAFWRGETAINELSLGIELENLTGATDPKTGRLLVQGQDPYPDDQIAALTHLTHELMARYDLTPDNIARHLDVALPKGRKSDPAGFPWGNWLSSLNFRQLPRYQARYRCPVWERSDGHGAAWGVLERGEVVTVDATYVGGMAHLADHRGFVRLADLEQL